MWVSIKKQKPNFSKNYMCFGTLNRGSKYQCKEKFEAKFNVEDDCFTDEDGDDLKGINESVEYWFDFSKVKNPL